MARTRRNIRQREIVVNTYKLRNEQTNKIEEFPLYTDKEVGLGVSWVTDQQIETRTDDDVDTDEEIHDDA